MPFFQQFRPETSYKWADKASARPSLQEGSVNETQRAVSTLGSRIRGAGMKFGGFNERPDWFTKMYQLESNVKRKCKCCNRFNCAKQFSSPPLAKRTYTSPAGRRPQTQMKKHEKQSMNTIENPHEYIVTGGNVDMPQESTAMGECSLRQSLEA